MVVPPISFLKTWKPNCTILVGNRVLDRIISILHLKKKRSLKKRSLNDDRLPLSKELYSLKKLRTNMLIQHINTKTYSDSIMICLLRIAAILSIISVPTSVSSERKLNYISIWKLHSSDISCLVGSSTSTTNKVVDR